MKFRLLSAIIILSIIIWGYWWLSSLLIISATFYFPKYYEAIFFGVVYDALYGLELSAFHNQAHIFTIFAILSLLISFYTRKELIIYNGRL